MLAPAKSRTLPCPLNCYQADRLYFSVSGTAPGTSRKAILNDSEQPWTSPSLPGHVHLTFTAIKGASHIALTFQGKSSIAPLYSAKSADVVERYRLIAGMC